MKNALYKIGTTVHADAVTLSRSNIFNYNTELAL